MAGKTGCWLKTKCEMREELVIGGFTRSENTREGFSALLLGAYVRPGISCTPVK
jgi:bifunctional non-homologous end joining protein LigD